MSRKRYHSGATYLASEILCAHIGAGLKLFQALMSELM